MPQEDAAGIKEDAVLVLGNRGCHRRWGYCEKPRPTYNNFALKEGTDPAEMDLKMS